MPGPSARPINFCSRSRLYQGRGAQQQTVLANFRSNVDNAISDGPKLWHQLMIGFTCAGFVGLVMLVLGTVFIAEAFSKQQSITVMLCVMGIVFGIIILVGTFILGRLLISRKWVRCQGQRDTIPEPHCLHTCSVIYSPSLDQLGASESMLEPPPPYDSVVPIVLHPLHVPGAVETEPPDQMPVMLLPPKYEEITQPLPDYFEEHCTTKLS